MKLPLFLSVMLMTVNCTPQGRGIIHLGKENGGISYISNIVENENPYPDAATYNFGEPVVHGKVIRSISYTQTWEGKGKCRLFAGRPHAASFSNISVIFVENEGQTSVYSALLGWSFIHDGAPGHGETDGIYYFQSTMDNMSSEIEMVVEFLDKKKGAR